MPRIYQLFLPIVLAILASSCASVFAPRDVAPPDIDKISVGMDRSQVEQILGSPISDVRPGISSGAFRKCEYRYMLRESVQADASYIQILSNNMLGFEEHAVIVYYDSNRRVLKIEKRDLHKSNGRQA